MKPILSTVNYESTNGFLSAEDARNILSFEMEISLSVSGIQMSRNDDDGFVNFGRNIFFFYRRVPSIVRPNFC